MSFYFIISILLFLLLLFIGLKFNQKNKSIDDNDESDFHINFDDDFDSD